MQNSSFAKYVQQFPSMYKPRRTRAPLAGYSHFADKTKRITNHKIIILGEHGFFNLVVNDATNSICQPFAEFTQETYHIFSYLVQNNKYLVVFEDTGYYNVYDISQGKWLLHKSKAVLPNFRSTCSRGVIIDDEILIIYDWKPKKLKFYLIGKDYLVNPLLVHEYEIQTNPNRLNGCGMCVTNLMKQQSTCQFNIMLFGGRIKSCLPFFYSLNISISHLQKMTNNLNDSIIVIKEHFLDENEIQCINIDKSKKLRWINLSVECISNFKNEPVIVIFGGTDQKTDIHLFNCHTKTFIRKQNVKYSHTQRHCNRKYQLTECFDTIYHRVQVLPFKCSVFPGAIKCNNNHNQSVIIAHRQKYFELNIYNSRNSMEWGRERILWIGFYQNNDNNQCLMKRLPKDVLKYILSFIGMIHPYIVIDV